MPFLTPPLRVFGVKLVIVGLSGLFFFLVGVYESPVIFSA
jgi:hypothetical protein